MSDKGTMDTVTVGSAIWYPLRYTGLRLRIKDRYLWFLPRIRLVFVGPTMGKLLECWKTWRTALVMKAILTISRKRG